MPQSISTDNYMSLNGIYESTKIFVFNIPATIKRTSIWLIISYLIPIINISIIWGMRESYKLDLSMLSIILATNACFITSLVFLLNKKRELIKTLNIVTLIICIVLFSISVVQTELKIVIFSYNLYKYGSFGTLILSILIGLISKYDEVEASSKDRAQKGKSTTETTIGNKKVQV